MADLVDAGCDRVVMTSLSPFESKVACGAYREAAAAAAAGDRHQPVSVRRLHCTRHLSSEHSSARHVVVPWRPRRRAEPLVVMTAHSLPESDLIEDDPYVGGLREVSEEVATPGRAWRRKRFRRRANSAGSRFVRQHSKCDTMAAGVSVQGHAARRLAWSRTSLMSSSAASRCRIRRRRRVPRRVRDRPHGDTVRPRHRGQARRSSQLGCLFVRAAVPNASPQLIEGVCGTRGADAVSSSGRGIVPPCVTDLTDARQRWPGRRMPVR